MTLPRLPGIGDAFEKLPDVAHNIMSALDPNLDTKLALRQAIVTNPQLAQNLTALSQDNPQLYQMLGLGKLGGAIQQSPLDTKHRMERAARTALDDPQVATDAGRLQVVGKTKKDEQEQDNRLQDQAFNIAQQPTRAKLNEQQVRQNDFELEYLEKRTGEIQEAFTTNPTLADIDVRKVATQFFETGNIDSRLLNRIALSPLSQYFSSLLNDIGNERARKAGVSERRDIIAEGLTKESKAGDVNMWRRYLDSPQLQERADGLANGTIPQNSFEDAQLRAMGIFVRRNREAEEVSARSRLQKQLDNMKKNFKANAPDADEQIKQMNLIQQQLENLGGPQGQEVGLGYTPNPWRVNPDSSPTLARILPNEKKQIVTKTKEKVAPNNPTGPAGTPSAATMQNVQAEQQKIDQLKAHIKTLSGPAREAALKKIKAQYPEYYPAVTNGSEDE